MAGIIGSFPNMFIRGLKELFSTNYKELPSVGEQIFNVMSSEKNFEEMLSMVGFGKLPEESELETVTLQDPMEGFKSRFTHVKFGLGYQISQELVDDDMYGQISQFPAALARSARATMESKYADVFNLGFSGGVALPDGDQLFSADHDMKRGGTLKNRPTTDADLAFTSLRTAAIDLRKIHDDSDLPYLGSEEITLLVAPDEEFNAAEIVKSVERPDTANRAANALAKQRRWNLIVWDYLTDVDAWFLVYPKAMHKLVSFDRSGIKQEADRDVKTDAWYHIARYRKSVGVADWRGAVGNPGA